MDEEQRLDLVVGEHAERLRAFRAETFNHHVPKAIASSFAYDKDDLCFLRIRRNLNAAVDAHIDESTVFVELVKLRNVVDESIFVEFAFAKERESRARLDLRGEFIGVEGLVADEEDFLHLDARAFDDAKNENPRVFQEIFIDRHFGEVVAALSVELFDPRDGLLEQEVVARPARVERNGLAKILIGDQFVADDLQVAHDRLLGEHVREFDRAIGKHLRNRIDGIELPEAIERRDVVANGLRFERLPRSDANVVEDLALSDAVEALEDDLRDRPIGERFVIDRNLRARRLGDAASQGDRDSE